MDVPKEASSFGTGLEKLRRRGDFNKDPVTSTPNGQLGDAD